MGGDTVLMQPPFFCDYGTNIELGTPFDIGSDVWVGSGALILLRFSGGVEIQAEVPRPVAETEELRIGGVVEHSPQHFLPFGGHLSSQLERALFSALSVLHRSQRQIRPHRILNHRIRIFAIRPLHRLDDLAPFFLDAAQAFGEVAHGQVDHP